MQINQHRRLATHEIRKRRAAFKARQVLKQCPTRKRKQACGKFGMNFGFC